MPNKTIKRSLLVKGAEALETIYLKDLPSGATVGDARNKVAEIISDDQLDKFKAYCKASSEYEIIEDL